jgi:hypothetical protein
VIGEGLLLTAEFGCGLLHLLLDRALLFFELFGHLLGFFLLSAGFFGGGIGVFHSPVLPVFENQGYRKNDDYNSSVGNGLRFGHHSFSYTRREMNTPGRLQRVHQANFRNSRSR